MGLLPHPSLRRASTPDRRRSIHARTERVASLVPGTVLAFADLHNHSHLSDGEGGAELAFDRMREAGLDVAALTDHARVGRGLPGADPCDGEGHGCRGFRGLDEDAWQLVGRLADLANDDGAFVAMRGFEWTSPALGHVNVWDSTRWIDALTTEAFSHHDWMSAWSLDRLQEMPSACISNIRRAIQPSWVERPSMHPFLEWLAAPAASDARGGGDDGLASFNHPGRSGMRFDRFTPSAGAMRRMVALEIFNRDEDYLFEGTDQGEPSPLVECLGAGWRVGLSGVTDEHGDVWGSQEHLGRTGLWIHDLTRAGVREALRARRFYATRVAGLRLDATANDVRMGGSLERSGERTRVRLEIDRGPDWWGKPLLVQALGPGMPMPTIQHEQPILVEEAGQRLTFEVPPVHGWMVLRITDPAFPADPRAGPPWNGFGAAVAYTSPFFEAPENSGASLS